MAPPKPIPLPNRWSCLAACFAMLLDIDLATVWAEVGHDGSQIIRPDELPPRNRRGFHPQELIQCCAIPRGVGVITLEAEANIGDVCTFPLPLLTPADSYGILLDYRHAVVWYGNQIICPSGGTYELGRMQMFLRFCRL